MKDSIINNTKQNISRNKKKKLLFSNFGTFRTLSIQNKAYISCKKKKASISQIKI